METRKIKDVRLIAVFIAVACMALDNLPVPWYGTFNDPGGAAMLSIIFADAIALAVSQGRIVLAIAAFFPSLLLKYFIQPFFWVQEAVTIDVFTLMTAHALLGFLSLRGAAPRIRFIIAVTTFGMVGIVAVLACMIASAYSSWIQFWFELAAARILIPCVFWSTVLRLENRQQIL